MKNINIELKRIIFFVIVLFSFGLSWNSFASTIINNNSSQGSTFSLAPMLEKVVPSVISINIEGSTVVRTFRLPHQLQPFFDNHSPFCKEHSPFHDNPKPTKHTQHKIGRAHV